jgi:hypothetical protein
MRPSLCFSAIKDGLSSLCRLEIPFDKGVKISLSIFDQATDLHVGKSVSSPHDLAKFEFEFMMSIPRERLRGDVLPHDKRKLPKKGRLSDSR